MSVRLGRLKMQHREERPSKEIARSKERASTKIDVAWISWEIHDYVNGDADLPFKAFSTPFDAHTHTSKFLPRPHIRSDETSPEECPHFFFLVFSLVVSNNSQGKELIYLRYYQYYQGRMLKI